MAANYICIKQKTKVYGEMRWAMVVANMAANYICIKQKTKVYGEMRWAMVVILGIWVEYMKS